MTLCKTLFGAGTSCLSSLLTQDHNLLRDSWFFLFLLRNKTRPRELSRSEDDTLYAVTRLVEMRQQCCLSETQTHQRTLSLSTSEHLLLTTDRPADLLPQQYKQRLFQ